SPRLPPGSRVGGAGSGRRPALGDPAPSDQRPGGAHGRAGPGLRPRVKRRAARPPVCPLVIFSSNFTGRPDGSGYTRGRRQSRPRPDASSLSASALSVLPGSQLPPREVVYAVP